MNLALKMGIGPGMGTLLPLPGKERLEWRNRNIIHHGVRCSMMAMKADESMVGIDLCRAFE